MSTAGVFKRNRAVEYEGETLRARSQWVDVWRRLLKNRLAVVGMIVVVLLVLVCAFANVIAPYDPNVVDPINRLAFPSREHWFGTDNYGRDLLTRLLYGGRISLLVSLMSVGISLVAGAVIGAVAGYFGGMVDNIIMRLMDIMMAIPGTLLIICVSALLGSGVWQTAVAVSIGGIPGTARMLRATALSIRSQEYVEAARAGGSRHSRIIWHHVVPNCLPLIIVEVSMKLGGNIMMISGLSFIGLGVQPPTPEWGSILNTGREYIREFWPLITFPGLAIMLAVFGFNVFGDGLRDALDPKMKD